VDQVPIIPVEVVAVLQIMALPTAVLVVQVVEAMALAI
jgi:hypothetical protein